MCPPHLLTTQSGQNKQKAQKHLYVRNNRCTHHFPSSTFCLPPPTHTLSLASPLHTVVSCLPPYHVCCDPWNASPQPVLQVRRHLVKSKMQSSRTPSVIYCGYFPYIWWTQLLTYWSQCCGLLRVNDATDSWATALPDCSTKSDLCHYFLWGLIRGSRK